MDDGRVHPLARTPPSHVINLWWNIVIDDWNMNEKSLGQWQIPQHCKPITPSKIYKEWYYDTMMLDQQLVLVTLYRMLQLVLSKTIRISDTR